MWPRRGPTSPETDRWWIRTLRSEAQIPDFGISLPWSTESSTWHGNDSLGIDHFYAKAAEMSQFHSYCRELRRVQRSRKKLLHGEQWGPWISQGKNEALAVSLVVGASKNPLKVHPHSHNVCGPELERFLRRVFAENLVWQTCVCQSVAVPSEKVFVVHKFLEILERFLTKCTNLKHSVPFTPQWSFGGQNYCVNKRKSMCPMSLATFSFLPLISLSLSFHCYFLFPRLIYPTMSRVHPGHLLTPQSVPCEDFFGSHCVMLLWYSLCVRVCVMERFSALWSLDGRRYDLPKQTTMRFDLQ